MTIKTSTGLRDRLLLPSGSGGATFSGTFNLGFINIYGSVGGTATVPATADLAANSGGAILLCTISNNATATGLTFATTASGGVITKNLSETWKGNPVASGVAQFFRLVTATDGGISSTSVDGDARVQGTIGAAGADMNLANTTFTIGTPVPIDFFALALPTA